MNDDLLRLEKLRIDIHAARGTAAVVDDVSLAVAAGRVTALVGESGCGKSMTALAVPRLLPAAACCVGGRIHFDGRDLRVMPEEELRRVRGRRIGMVFQEPMAALNPLMTIGRQVAEAIELHAGVRPREAARRAVQKLAEVALSDPQRVARQYPHQLSGGMRQRAMIAVALAGDPDLIIADEPTTALDATIQAQILELLCAVTRQRGRALLLITHDFGVVSAVADDVAVMYAGRIVERGPAAQVLARPRHPYTAALLRCVPRLRGPRVALPVIPGAPPAPFAWPGGCRYHPRCALASDDARCRHEQPTDVSVGADHVAACWKTENT
ncbi:MAG: ABC transporter ATP-binding protein [Phycisphaerae bacterium]|nr:ABC transporter ATP-binding protein [Phycisphaerae bacterium]